MRKLFFLLACLLIFSAGNSYGQYKMEYLTRGVHAINNGKGQIFVSWRLLGTEENNLGFNLYRTTNKKTTQLNKQPILTSTNFTDASADTNLANIYSPCSRKRNSKHRPLHQ